MTPPYELDLEMLVASEHRLRRFLPLLEANPRAMKRLVTAYSMYDAYARASGGIDVDRDQVALWTILELRYPALADYLKEYPLALEPLRGAAVALSPKDAPWQEFMDAENEHFGPVELRRSMLTLLRQRENVRLLSGAPPSGIPMVDPQFVKAMAGLNSSA